MSVKPLDERAKWILVLLVMVPTAIVFTLVEPFPQPQDYFDFADQRTVLGISNFWNVTSNVVFVFAGIAGLFALRDHSLVIEHELRPAAGILFAGVFLTAFGSGWFHLAPNNDTLVWDRLPMTIGFMSLFTIVIGEQLSLPLARRFLLPLLAVGFASVLYWGYTEAHGVGDLRLYGLVQFLPLILIPLLLLAWSSPYDSTRFYWIALALYAVAKLFEALDAAIFSAGELQSGHALKHVAAGVAMYVLERGMQQRKRKNSEDVVR